MNYQKIYDQLIEKRRNFPIFRKDIYCEKHHIIPRCIKGTDEKENLVNLTAKEHFIAHLLLCKIYPNIQGLFFAIWRMCCTKNRYIISAREYDYIRNQYIIRLKNIPRTKEWNDKISKTRKEKGLASGKLNPHYGKTNYTIWLEKYGKEEADKRQIEYVNEWTKLHCGENHYTEKMSEEEYNEWLKNRSGNNHPHYIEISEELKEKVIYLYLNEFLGPLKIGKILGYSSTFISKILKNNNIEIRGRKEGRWGQGWRNKNNKKL